MDFTVNGFLPRCIEKVALWILRDVLLLVYYSSADFNGLQLDSSSTLVGTEY